MMLNKLMAGAVAAFLLVVAPETMAQSLDDVWLVVGESSASGTEYLEGEDLCMVAFQSLIEDHAFVYRNSAQIQPQLVAFFFSRPLETVTLFCASEIEIGRPGNPGRPGGPGDPGGPGGPGGPNL